MTDGWFIVLCEPNRELVAVAGMTERGLEAMCPADYIRRRTGRRDASGRPVLSKEATPKAMIPGYAFVKFAGAPLYDLVKATPGVNRFYRVVGLDPMRPRYGMLTDAQIEDLRAADTISYRRFQASMLPNGKRKPEVQFEPGKPVCFTTKFGQEIFGQMVQRKGSGMVSVVARHMSFLVSEHDLRNGAAA